MALPPRLPMLVLPSARTTSSIVRLPTTTTRRWPGCSVTVSSPSLALDGGVLRLPRCSLRRDLPEGQPEVDPLAPVDQDRPDVPERADDDHPDHEVERQGPGDRERLADLVVEDEGQHQPRQGDETAH